eukprot:ANDGO_00098.mRNA.1 hypothetical protein
MVSAFETLSGRHFVFSACSSAFFAIAALTGISVMDQVAREHSTSSYSYSDLEYSFSMDRAKDVIATFELRAIIAVSISIGLHALGVLTYPLTLALIVERVRQKLARKAASAQYRWTQRFLWFFARFQLVAGMFYSVPTIGMMLLLLQSSPSDHLPLIIGVGLCAFMGVLGITILVLAVGLFFLWKAGSELATSPTYGYDADNDDQYQDINPSKTDSSGSRKKSKAPAGAEYQPPDLA